MKNQLAAPRFPVAVEQIALADAGRTLGLTTAPRTSAVDTAITFATDVFGTGATSPYAGQIDLLADLHGLTTEWRATESSSVAKHWLPHLDFTVARELTAPGGAQRDLWSALTQPGTLTLRGQIDLGDICSDIFSLAAMAARSTPPQSPPPVETKRWCKLRSGPSRPSPLTSAGRNVSDTPRGLIRLRRETPA